MMNTEIVARDGTGWVRPFDDVMAAASQLIYAPLPVDRHQPGNRSFFEGKSIKELAQSQGVGPAKDISVFAGGIPDDEDVDEMLEEIYRLREP
jgi:hypothetical protein